MMSRTRRGRRFFGSGRTDLFVTYEFVMRLPRSGEQLLESKEYSLKQLLLPDNLHLSELGHDVYVEVVGSNLLARIGHVMLPDW